MSLSCRRFRVIREKGIRPVKRPCRCVITSSVRPKGDLLSRPRPASVYSLSALLFPPSRAFAVASPRSRSVRGQMRQHRLRRPDLRNGEGTISGLVPAPTVEQSAGGRRSSQVHRLCTGRNFHMIAAPVACIVRWKWYQRRGDVLIAHFGRRWSADRQSYANSRTEPAAAS